MFGLENWGVEPDMIQFAKAITSGYFSLGGIGISDEMAEVMHESGQPWMHAYTYSAHPTGCAIGCAMLELVEREDFPAQAASKGKRLLVGLKDALASHPHVGEVRGLGLMCAVEYVKDRATKENFDPAEGVAARINAEALSRGLFSRFQPDIYFIAPPVVTDEDTIDRAVEIIAESTRAVLG